MLKYKIIKSKEQYNDYCLILKSLLENKLSAFEDEIELLTLLIENYDSEHYQASEIDPVQIILSLMEDHNLKAIELAEILSLSKGSISKILNYQKGISKETIRRLSDYFKLNQEIFNQPYKLKNSINDRFKNEALMNTQKDLSYAN